MNSYQRISAIKDLNKTIKEEQEEINTFKHNQNMEENYDPEQDINGLNDIENNNINYNNNEEEEINDLNDINDENYGDNNYEFDENNINMNLPPQLQMNQKYTNYILQYLKNTNAQTQKFIKGPLQVLHL